WMVRASFGSEHRASRRTPWRWEGRWPSDCSRQAQMIFSPKCVPTTERMPMGERARVVLFRSSRADDPYALQLQAAGFDVVHRPLLNFRPTNEQAFTRALARPDDFSGLVITSERGADRLNAAGAPAAWV